jgi:hypothetical protein
MSESNSQNAISQLEQTLLTILKKEYAFYQSLYVLMDKQRDLIKYDKDEHLLDLYAEIERCQKRISESEAKVTAIRDKNPRLFKLASIHPEIRKVVTSIATLIKKSIKLVDDNKEFLANRHERIRVEMDELKNSRKIMQYMSQGDARPQFVDGKK